MTDKNDSVDRCMDLMLYHHIRHLPIQDEQKKVVGMVSIKDLIKVVVEDKEKTIQALSDLVLGKGGRKLV
jgi:CBS-domain-containing membrane protein